ncbi:MAG: Hsp70 family protein [Sandaracinaceae bacterium]|nr:Hsp70 family protein [Sandaracinaceae bacterium]
MSEASYAVGIDLGTTHCAVSYVDLDLSEGETVAQHVLPIPQVVAPGTIEDRALLPSFLYLPGQGELAEGDLTLPWDAAPAYGVGEIARALGQKTPIRVVSSAKSWLCHGAVDRLAPILPPHAPEEVQKVSPLTASILYLEHLRDAWNAKHPDAPLDEQDVVITVPASFDPAARELTAEAAREAGLEQFVLLEEPQAALYSWIQGTDGAWRERVSVGDVILVVDVGGGTTDLSLMVVAEREGSLALQRVAVGDHILLGGDNMDLALAVKVRTKIEAEGDRQLDAWQLGALTHACRAAKETLLGDASVELVPIVVPSRGRKLVGGSIKSELTRAEVEELLVEGFFPRVASDARPAARPRGALTQLGLPYAQDAAITRHLAAFLTRQLGAAAEVEGFTPRQPEGATFLHPTAILFNGGVFESKLLEARVTAQIGAWLEADGGAPARVLEGARLDLAVARGAAYYGYVRRGRGVRIRGGTVRSYYVGVEAAMPAVPGMAPPISAICVAPFGMEEGTRAEPAPQELGLVVGEPVSFRFFGSSVRRDDQVGTFLERWRDDELEELPEIQATLPAEGRTVGDVVPVRLAAAVTEVGVLELEAIPRAGAERWKVELDVRAGDQG